VKTSVRGYVCAVSSVILIFTAAFLSGCSGLVSANGTNPQLHAAIQVNPASVNFGSAIVGKKVAQNVSIANTGNMAVNISQANMSNSQFSLTGLTLPLSLTTGQTSSFQVWFDPSSPGNVSGTLTVATDAGVSSEQVALAGTATAAPQQISLNPASLGLGTIAVGSTGKGTATVSNVGGSNLTISMISVGAGPFGVSGMTTPSTIAPGGSGALNVTYSPALAGDNSGVITIISNDPQTPTSTIALTGTATTTSVIPTITTQPVGQTVTAGQSATFTVVAAGTAPLSYQWQKNGVNVAGATAASYTTPVTATSDSGSTFDVVVSNTAGTVTSAAATLTVNAAAVAPTITTQPTNQTVTAGQTATFTVVAAGTAALSYQWQKNGANVAGATSASYTTPVTATSDSGSTFRVVVSNTVGTVSSAAATLTVTVAPVAPTITTPPANQTVSVGQPATFTVLAAGTAPLSYQWQKNGANVAGATAASYTTPVTTTSDNGSTYDVVVSNTAGTVTSAVATLTVNAVAPTITTAPVNQTVTAGQSATFTVVAAGTAPLSYQWQKNGVNIAGATAASYTTPLTATSDSGSTFDVVVSNTAGTVTSAAATLTVNAAPVAPTITTQPTNQTVTAGQTATFTVVTAGTAPLSYQWQKNGVNVAGATAASYTTPVTATSDSGTTFDVVVSNTAGTVTSAAATLTVNAAPVTPTITTQPTNQTVTAGQTATFTVVAAGTAPLSYQWQKNGVNVAGATAASYTTPVTATSDSGSTFRVVVSNTVGTVSSTTATLTVTVAPVSPTITTQPANQTVTAGQTATFTVVAAGTAPLSYQWQKNGVNVAGATAASYTTPVTATSDSGTTFDVVVSNAAGTVNSAAATLTVNAVAPTITTAPVNQTVTAGQSATFTVVAAGTAPLGYQWQKNGVNVAGATAASYTTPVTTTSDSGSTFRIVVSNTAGTVTSAAATLTVNAAPVTPTITTQPTNQTVTAGQTATFTVVATGTAPLSYQWQKNGVNIAGATSASYTTPVTATSDSGSTFRVVVSNTAGTVTSAAATLTVNAAPVAPTITTQPTNQTVTAGQTATFTVVAAGTAPLSYQWQKNGVNIAGATAASYATPATTTSDSGSTFAAAVSNTAGAVTSSAATLTVNPAPAPAIQVNPTSINFVNGVVGTNLSQVLIIKNTGTATLSIAQVTETGSAFFTVSGFSLPLNVNAGQQTTITVAFLPTSVGTVSGNISIVSNAPTSPTSVGLSGTGIAATLTLGISPTSLSFGNVTTGTSSAAQNVTITNTGNSNVTISQINLSGAGYSMTGGSAPVTLTPSQNLSLTIQFSPTAAGIVNGNILIVSNATGSPVTVSLSGTGVAQVQHSVNLTWNASTSTVSGYNVYRSTVSGTGYVKINSSLVTALNYTDSTVQSGTTYFYVTTAVDSTGSESVYSNEVSAPIP